MACEPFETAFTYTLRNEGQGFTNDPDDHGGATHYGLTLATLKAASGPFATVEQLKHLSVEEAKEIYRRLFWVPLKIDGLGSDSLKVALFDVAVICGPVNAVRLLQAALGVTQDGLLGPNTLAAANMRTTQELVFGFSQALSAYFLVLARRDATQKKWLYGWLCRSARLLTLSI